VLFNLLDNALKYSADNPVINVNLTETEAALQLTVTDNGMGIAPEYRSRIFEKFFRVPHGDVHNAKGYGLGLSYAAHVVEQHKGSIRVEGNDGGGSRFVVVLPKTEASFSVRPLKRQESVQR
jgi:two-component system phosphate regulon sensor histidine kinase PhoR